MSTDNTDVSPVPYLYCLIFNIFKVKGRGDIAATLAQQGEAMCRWCEEEGDS
jgi:hypothetical protein